MCSRAKNHFDPATARQLRFTESGEGATETGTSASEVLDRYKQSFKSLHPNTAKNMYCEFFDLTVLLDDTDSTASLVN